jgi:hypothetical protein
VASHIELNGKKNNLDKIFCSHANDSKKLCKVSYKCEDCKNIKHNDILEIEINNSFIQLYKWNFESIWGENYDYKKGYSKLTGLFKPENNLKY